MCRATVGVWGEERGARLQMNHFGCVKSHVDFFIGRHFFATDFPDRGNIVKRK